MRRGWVAAVCVVAAACYRTPEVPRCALRCQAACPGDLTCGDDHFCHAPGDLMSCDGPDAATPDAPGPDAAAPDAAAPDAPPPPIEYRVIAAGRGHTCAIAEGGALYCWGNNLLSQLGVATAEPYTGVPQPVSPDGWTHVAAGDLHTCGIRSGSVQCWGDNQYLQSGMIGGGVIFTPTPVIGGGSDWIAVSTGHQHSCGIRGTAAAGGRLYCWGTDSDGRLGNGAAGGGATPSEVLGPGEGTSFTDWIEVACGWHHTCGRRLGGETYCWGPGSYGELGDGAGVSAGSPVAVAAGPFSTIAAGQNRSAGIVGDELFYWGDWPPVVTGPLLAPVSISSGMERVALGGDGGCAIGTDGGMRCWGSAPAVGSGRWDFESTLVYVAGVEDVVSLAAGTQHRCAVAQDGRAWCWGENHDGQLGVGTVSRAREPVIVGAALGGWREVSAGGYHTCAIRDPEPGDPPSAELYCWGWNSNVQLGVAAPDSPAPVQVSPATAWHAVELGWKHTCAVHGDTPREVWCWGSDNLGQLGNGGGPGELIAMQIFDETEDLRGLEVGHEANCAVLASGARKCWGDNFDGGLGNGGATGVVDSPILPDAISWNRIALGWHFGCGIDATGDLLCWGRDSNGQQGRGPADDGSTAPVVTDATREWDVVTAREGHACGIAAGALSCWGWNYRGQLGIGAMSDADAPTAVASPATGWSDVSAGWRHTCGIAAGDLYCWGVNDEGMLGIPSMTQANTPQPVGDAALGWVRISSGYNHTCGITDDQTLYCWGSGQHGQLGDGSQSHASPVEVFR